MNDEASLSHTKGVVLRRWVTSARHVFLFFLSRILYPSPGATSPYWTYHCLGSLIVPSVILVAIVLWPLSCLLLFLLAIVLDRYCSCMYISTCKLRTILSLTWLSISLYWNPQTDVSKT